MYFNVNFSVFFKLIKVLLLVGKLCMYQNVRYNNKEINICVDGNSVIFCDTGEVGRIVPATPIES